MLKLLTLKNKASVCFFLFFSSQYINKEVWKKCLRISNIGALIILSDNGE